MYIFGSRLIKKIFPEFREPKDHDWVTNDITEFNSKVSTKDIEYYYITCTPNREMTADEIYTLKVSHAIYNIHWQKTMSDIRFLQIKGCKIIPEFLEDLRKHWSKVHNKKRCDFNKDGNTFFNDNVKREIEHDELHKLINPNPSYKLIVDGVKPDKYKFDKLQDWQKDDICFEEAYVIAIERFCDKLPPKKSYNMAQQILVTRLHPVWLADWVIQNWNKTFWITKNNYYETYKTIID
jgi:hypothetical protein